MKVFTSTKQPLVLVSKLAQGGQGSIHTISSCTSLVVKLYLNPQLAQAAQKRVEFMVNNNPFVNAVACIKDTFCWPQELLYDSKGDFIGFSMPYVQNAKPCYLLTIPKGFTEKDFIKFNVSEPESYLFRLKILYNISNALNYLHQSGKFGIIDFKPPNIMLKKNGEIVIIDTDSFQISTNKNQLLFPAEAVTPEYAPAEYHKNLLNFQNERIDSSWDIFSFSVIAYQVLLNIHPFTGSHHILTTLPDLIRENLWAHAKKGNSFIKCPLPHTQFHKLSKNLQALFFQCFDSGYNNPKLRPNFAAWRDNFLIEINEINKKSHSSPRNNPFLNSYKPLVAPTVIKPNEINKKSHSSPRNNPFLNSYKPLVAPTVIKPLPLVIINSFVVQPCQTPNKALLVWNTTNAQCCFINHVPSASSGSMIIPLQDAQYLIEVTDLGQSSISHQLDFIPSVQIEHFSYTIANGFIELKWNVIGGTQLLLNNLPISPSCSTIKVPFAKTFELKALNNGFIAAKILQVKKVVCIKEFDYNIQAGSGRLFWEILNAQKVLLDGQIIWANKGSIPINLSSCQYLIEAFDSIGGKDTRLVSVSVKPVIKEFGVRCNEFTGTLTWHIDKAKQVLINDEICSPHGEKAIPLISREFTLKVIDFDNRVLLQRIQFKAPKIVLQKHRSSITKAPKKLPSVGHIQKNNIPIPATPPPIKEKNSAQVMLGKPSAMIERSYARIERSSAKLKRNDLAIRTPQK